MPALSNSVSMGIRCVIKEKYIVHEKDNLIVLSMEVISILLFEHEKAHFETRTFLLAFLISSRLYF